jgi:hypothetical protein
MSMREVLPNFYAAGRLARALGHRIRAVLPGLVFLCLLVDVGANVWAGRALERELALVRARGEPLSLTEVAPPRVPDDQNAALLYARAFALLPRQEQNPQVDGSEGQRLARQDELVLRQFLGERKGQPPVVVSTRQVRQALAGTEAALALVRRAAAMPRCRFPVDWEAGAAALLPHYPQLISLSRLLAAQAIVAAHDGKPSEAAADLQAILGLTRHIAAEPIVVGQLAQYACLVTAVHSLNRVMQLTSLSEADSRQIEQALAQRELYGPFERAVLEERCLGLWAFDLAREDPARLRAYMGGGDHPLLWLSRQLGFLGDPLLKLDEVCYLRAMTREVALAKERGRLAPDGFIEEGASVPWYAVTRFVLPALGGAMKKRDHAAAEIALARWGLALHVYRQRTGDYPPSLAAVDGQFGGKLPQDPLTGEVFAYRRQGDGFVLYSLGTNGRDSEGRANQGVGTASPQPDDIAWRIGG